MAISTSQQMVFRASQELKDKNVIFVGIGLPNLACNLARALHAPNLFMIYEAGAVGAVPERLPISIGDPALVTGAASIVSQAEIFQYYLQRGLIEVGFLGGAQIDMYGNINSTVIGDYENPKVRLPGSGGACEIATHAKRLLVVMRMTKRSFVEKCDFITSPGHLYGSKTRKELGLPGGGPQVVITDQCVMNFVEGKMQVIELFAGQTKESVQDNCGFELQFSTKLKETAEPTKQITDILQKLDPKKLYL